MQTFTIIYSVAGGPETTLADIPDNEGSPNDPISYKLTESDGIEAEKLYTARIFAINDIGPSDEVSWDPINTPGTSA